MFFACLGLMRGRQQALEATVVSFSCVTAARARCASKRWRGALAVAAHCALQGVEANVGAPEIRAWARGIGVTNAVGLVKADRLTFSWLSKCCPIFGEVPKVWDFLSKSHVRLQSASC